MDEFSVAEKLLAGVIAVGTVIAGFSNRVTKLYVRIATIEKDIEVMKLANGQALATIQNDISALRNEMRSDIRSIQERSEERHDRTDAKLDRLIERNGNGVK